MSTLNTKEEYLLKSIKSIINQTYPNFEFIIVVDGGNDKQIIDKINDNRIKIIEHNTTKGLATSLNEAIELAKGKYIARMDSDDIAEEDRIEIQLEYMEKRTYVDMTSTFYKEIGNSKKVVMETFTNSDDISAKLFYINPILHPSVMLRKDFLQKNHIKYDENYIYSQDYELWTRIKAKGKIEIIPQIIMKYRIHNCQISVEKFQKQSELYYEILTRNLEELELKKDDIRYLLMLNSRENNIEIKEIDDFIKRVIINNKKIKLYNTKALEKVLRTAFITILIKQKNFFNVVFFKNLKYIYYLAINKSIGYIRNIKYIRKNK